MAATNKKAEKKGTFLKRIAEKNGVAVVVLDSSSNEVASANNNSLCRALWDSSDFSPRCAEYCGKAFANTSQGDAWEYECHAGLACRAIPVEDRGRRFVTIVGRTFTSADKYRIATENTINGEWRGLKPTQVFSNILMSGSTKGIDRAVNALEKFVVREPEDLLGLGTARSTGAIDSELSSPQVATANVRREPSYVSRFRSLIGGLTKTSYSKACRLILEYLSSQGEYGSLIWLERCGDRLKPFLTQGELANKAIRLAIDVNDERLVSAADKGRPLVFKQRSGADEKTRTLSLLPIKIESEIRFAIAAEGLELEEANIAEILRTARAAAPKMEVLRLREKVATLDSARQGLRRFNESLRRFDAEDFWLQVTQRTAELMRAERASLLVLDEANDRLLAKAAIGAPADLLSEPDLGRRVAKRSLDTGSPMMPDDLATTGIDAAPAEWRYRSSSFISFPIIVDHKGIGVLNFADRVDGGPFGVRDIDILNSISPQIAMAIERTKFKQQANEFEQRSITDALTGLRNRGYLEERLTEEISQARRYRSSMCLVMLDVDNFKSYNDSFGHPAGDSVLKLVAAAFRETLRTADVAARYGGEEFAILLPHTTIDEATSIAERLRQRVERTGFPNRQVTISLGIAGYSPEFDEARDWITAADMALYDVKEHGRNGIRTYEQLGRSFREKIN